MPRALGPMIAEDFCDVGERLKKVEAIALVRNQQIDRAGARQALRAVGQEADEVWRVLDHMGCDDRVIAGVLHGLGERSAAPDEIDRLDHAGIEAIDGIFRDQAGLVDMIEHRHVVALGLGQNGIEARADLEYAIALRDGPLDVGPEFADAALLPLVVARHEEVVLAGKELADVGGERVESADELGPQSLGFLPRRIALEIRAANVRNCLQEPFAQPHRRHSYNRARPPRTISSALRAAPAAGETRSLPRAAPWRPAARPRRRSSGARSRRNASCALPRETSCRHCRSSR